MALTRIAFGAAVTTVTFRRCTCDGDSDMLSVAIGQVVATTTAVIVAFALVVGAFNAIGIHPLTPHHWPGTIPGLLSSKAASCAAYGSAGFLYKEDFQIERPPAGIVRPVERISIK